MSKRTNVAAALMTFAGLILLAPATSGSPQEQKPEQKKDECPCVIVDSDVRVRIPEVLRHRIVVPSGENIRRHVEEAIAQSQEWRGDHARMAAELRAQLAANHAEWQDYGYAIAGRARELAEQAGQEARAIFIEDGESGWLGVSISEVTDEKAKELKLAATRGVLIGEVEADSAAAKAGIKEGDVITDFNGQRVEGTVQFRRLVRETLAGRTVPVTVWREGRSQSLQVEMGTRTAQLRGRMGDNFGVFTAPDVHIEPNFRFEAMPRLELFASRTPTLGISGEDLSGDLGQYFGAPGGEGILVKEVHADTPAAKAGLKAGDVITSIDGERIKSLADLRAKLRGNREGGTLKVDVLRKGTAMSLNVEIEKPKAPATPRRITTRRSA